MNKLTFNLSNFPLIIFNNVLEIKMADYHEKDLYGTGSEPTNPRSRGELVDCLTTVTLIIEERLKFLF